MIPELFSRDRYYCVLDEQPEFLVPWSALAAYASLDGAGPLIVNPSCWLGWHGHLPPDLGAAVGTGEGLFDFPWIIWVDDRDRSAIWPYWLGPEYARLLESLEPGRPPDVELPEEVVRTLRISGILVTREAAEEGRRAWEAAVQDLAPQMARGLLPLSGLLPAYHVGALRRYYRYHTRVGTFTLGDEQTPQRFVAYDEPVTQFVHRQLTRTIGDVVGRPLAPSYNYLAFYQGGAVLDPHTDREECEYTISLCIDATPDPHTYGAWPLHVMSYDGPMSFTQDVGDGLLFRGRELPHWRDRLPEGYTASAILFHFVDAA
jgi:hypothetical protein